MIICLLLDISDIRRHSSSSEILLFDKGCSHYISTVIQKTNTKNFQRTVLKCRTLSNKELVKVSFFTSETNQRQ